ncbi:MAG: T9SS type A sorting domain-containing protein [Saprospiraceae bacterium]
MTHSPILQVFSTFCIVLFAASLSTAQSFPIDFEGDVTTAEFTNFDGGTATVIANPQASGINTSAMVGQIVRDGGEIYAGSKLVSAANFDLSVENGFTMKVFTTAPIGTVVKLKFEGTGAIERDALTTKTNEWEELSWDFTGAPSNFNEVVFMFDFGNVGNGSATSTFLFDDVTQQNSGAQIDLPVTFEDANVNYKTTDFGGNVSSITVDPTGTVNKVAQVIKTNGAATWAGTTIGTNAGFATNLPLSLTNSKMNVRVWSPTPGTPIRLKVENANDPTQTCETETNTTVSGWELIEFDFANEAPGTAELSVGLSMGWIYSMASIFFDYGSEGTAEEVTYFFDDVSFGAVITSTQDKKLSNVQVFPNPASDVLRIESPESYDEVRILSVDGKEVFSGFGESRLEVNLADFAKGVYFVHVRRGDATMIERVVVQ